MTDKVIVIPEPTPFAAGSWTMVRDDAGITLHTFTYVIPGLPPITTLCADDEFPQEARDLLIQAWLLIFPIVKARAGF